VRNKTADLWRGVEAQHVVSTMRLADNSGEQRVLEELLEASKPALPATAAGRHYLVFHAVSLSVRRSPRAFGARTTPASGTAPRS